MTPNRLTSASGFTSSGLSFMATCCMSCISRRMFSCILAACARSSGDSLSIISFACCGVLQNLTHELESIQ